MSSTDRNSGRCSAYNASRNQSQQQTNEAAAAAPSQRDSAAEEVPSLISLVAAARQLPRLPPSSLRLPTQSSSRSILNRAPLIPLSNDDVYWSSHPASTNSRSGVRMPSIAGALNRMLSEIRQEDDIMLSNDIDNGATRIEPSPSLERNNSQNDQSQPRRSGGYHRQHRPQGGNTEDSGSAPQ